MSKNRIIGVGGGLPWNLPADRQFFEDLTRNKLLIIGRNTLFETPTLSHLSHARATIVVSKTLSAEDAKESLAQLPTVSHPVIAVNSFSQALKEASHLSSSSKIKQEEDTEIQSTLTSSGDIMPAINMIDCWVAGGEKLYQEALQHPMAQFLHLTIVDKEIDVMEQNSTGQQVARFPAKYRWDHKFRLVEKEQESGSLHHDEGQQQPHREGDLPFTRFLYQHLNRLRHKV